MTREFMDYIDDIATEIDNIRIFTEGMTFDQFATDTKTAYAVVRSLEIIGEATKSISDDIRAKYPEVPWRKMAGMRDKLAHDYISVDWEVVWSAVKLHIPELHQLMLKIQQDNSDN